MGQPRLVGTLAGVELRLCGQVPLDRFRTDVAAVRSCLRVLRDGGVVGIFPEGRRGSGELERFHRGTAYCALARGNLFGSPKERLGPHPTLVEIAAKHSATVAQIGLSFLLHEGHVTLSTTIDTDQIASNLKARELALDDEDMYRLRAMDMRKRIVDTPYFPIFD